MEKKLYKSKTNKMLFGVCGGLGAYLNADPNIVRIIAVVAAFISLGIVVVAYIAAALILPEESV